MVDFVPHRGITKHDGSTVDSWHGYLCSHCGREVSGAVVARSEHTKWLECTGCGLGSVLELPDRLFPGVRFGPVIEGLPAEVADAYDEARNCMSVNAHTAAELVCRKLLMYVAVEKGAAEGDKFAAYLDHLEKQGYITLTMKPWVDLVRQHGNEATHHLAAPDRNRAESTTMFTAEMLRIVYEMPHVAARYGVQPQSTP
jgi:Domain of unknown function (DUF4145)